MKYKNTIIQRFSAINLSGRSLFIFIINNTLPLPENTSPMHDYTSPLPLSQGRGERGFITFTLGEEFGCLYLKLFILRTSVPFAFRESGVRYHLYSPFMEIRNSSFVSVLASLSRRNSIASMEFISVRYFLSTQILFRKFLSRSRSSRLVLEAVISMEG